MGRIRYVFSLLFFWVACITVVYAQDCMLVSDSLERTRTVDYYYLQACNCLEQGEYDKYYELLEHCHALDPESCAVMYDLASVYIFIGKDSLAHDFLTRIVKKDPLNQQYNKALLNFYTAKRNNEAAIELCERILEHSPSKSEMYIRLYSLYSEAGNNKKAIEILDKLELLEGRSEEISVNKLKQYMYLQDSVKAIETVQGLINDNPDDLRFRTLLGDTYNILGNASLALEQYNAVLNMQLDNAYALMSLATFHAQDEDDSLYCEYTERLLKSGELETSARVDALIGYINYKLPSDTIVVGELLKEMVLLPYDELEIAEVYVQYLMFVKENQEVIIPHLEKILAIDPENRSAMLQLLSFAIEREDYEAVVRYADNALMYIPEMLELYFYKGLSQYNLGAKEESIKTYEAGLERRSEDSSREILSVIYTALGDTYHELSMVDNCFQSYDSALVYNPDDYGVLNNYAYFLTLENRDLQRALEMSYETILAEPENPTYMDTYAWALFALGRYEEARAYMDKLLSLDEENGAVVYHHAGDVYAKCGDLVRAVEFWQKAVDLGDESKLLQKKIKKRKYYKDDKKRR